MIYLIDKIVVGGLQTNCYLLADAKSKLCAIIDPGGDSPLIKEHLKSKEITPSFIINTHGHPDHIMSNGEFDLPIYIHKDDAKALAGLHPDKLLNDGDKIQLENLTIDVIHTPGHTPGSICLLCDDLLFSGDTLFASGVGRTDLPGGSENQLINSIKNKLFILNGGIKVYPGHGPETTIGKEKEGNLWLQEKSNDNDKIGRHNQ
ncbi:MAG: MBL fold metallo-hydrolase [Candidatus Omnitrophota bacterium]|nr:MAG: MBL fold metallo-hydrolase [Candidatus Omnitrophota bacterium]